MIDRENSIAMAASAGICSSPRDSEPRIERKDLAQPVGQFGMNYDQGGIPIFTGCTALTGDKCTLIVNNVALAPDCPIKKAVNNSTETALGNEERDTAKESVTIALPDYELTLDRGTCEVRRSDKEGSIALTPIEFRMMDALVTNHGRVLSKVQLLEVTDPGSSSYRGTGNISTYVGYLRIKIDGPDRGDKQSFLQTKHGFGYMIPRRKAQKSS